jgi:dolichol-phosphate mannosyltransferase
MSVSANPVRHRLEPPSPLGFLSFVIPVYNEEAMIPLLRRELTAFIDTLPYATQVVLVNDGSTDRSLDLLAEWAERDRRVTVLGLARNFGHQAAVTAGLDFAKGEAIVILDADLQDPLDVIHAMTARYEQGYDVVYGFRVAREGETWFKRFTAWAFYRLMRKLVHPDLPADAGDFRLISRRCLAALQAMRETHRFLRGMVAWVGFPQIGVPYVRRPRAAGETKYPLPKMLKLAWTAATSFSPAALRLSFFFGLLLFLAGFLQALNAIVRSALGLYMVTGWASLIIVNCLVGGGILVSIGVLGEYVGRIFEQVKGRPLYLVATSLNTGRFPVPSQTGSATVEAALERMSQELR